LLKKTNDYPVRNELYTVGAFRKTYFDEGHLKTEVPTLKDLGYEEPA
jgi:hypothetical protein